MRYSKLAIVLLPLSFCAQARPDLDAPATPVQVAQAGDAGNSSAAQPAASSAWSSDWRGRAGFSWGAYQERETVYYVNPDGTQNPAKTKPGLVDTFPLNALTLGLKNIWSREDSDFSFYQDLGADLYWVTAGYDGKSFQFTQAQDLLDFNRTPSQQAQQEYRTDLVYVLGFTHPLDWRQRTGWGAFGGYRYSMKSDHTVFSANLEHELGSVVGLNFATDLTSSLDGAVAVAYNFNHAYLRDRRSDIGYYPQYNYDGISARLTLGFAGTPHQIQVRFQEFSGLSNLTQADAATLPAGAMERPRVAEQYLMVSYLYNFRPFGAK
jgi:hypothetical protein